MKTYTHVLILRFQIHVPSAHWRIPVFLKIGHCLIVCSSSVIPQLQLNKHCLTQPLSWQLPQKQPLWLGYHIATVIESEAQKTAVVCRHLRRMSHLVTWSKKFRPSVKSVLQQERIPSAWGRTVDASLGFYGEDREAIKWMEEVHRSALSKILRASPPRHRECLR